MGLGKVICEIRGHCSLKRTGAEVVEFGVVDVHYQCRICGRKKTLRNRKFAFIGSQRVGVI